MSDNKVVKKSFYDTLKKLSKASSESFTGVGMLLYENGKFSEKYHADLRPSFTCPKNVNLIDEKTTDMLLEVADKKSPLHDGFIFFDERGNLTHLSQYFAPLPNPNIIPNEAYGTRYRTAQIGSLIDGVILTGVICNTDKKPYIFEKGKCLFY